MTPALPPPLILASGSPRRAALLRQMGFDFRVVWKEVDENLEQGADPAETVLSLSALKAEAVLQGISEGLIAGADTVVVLEGEILGKPESPAEAGSMLRRLSGRTHEVFTGFTLINAATGARTNGFERTAVTFRRLDDWEIDAYVSTGMPMDKAGAYGIQDRSGLFVDRIDGCFYNVVGFPLARFYEGLKKMLGPETVRGMISPVRGRTSSMEDRIRA